MSTCYTRWSSCQPVPYEVDPMSTCVIGGSPYVNLCDMRFSLCQPV